MLMKLFKRKPGGLSCGEVMEVLQSYLDGEIDAETANKVSGHLDQCVDCDLEAGVYDRIRSSLAARTEPVDAGVLQNLEAFSQRLMNGEVDTNGVDND